MNKLMNELKRKSIECLIKWTNGGTSLPQTVPPRILALIRTNELGLTLTMRMTGASGAT